MDPVLTPTRTPAETVKPAVIPVQQAERLVIVDILRGFALFGILLVNMFSRDGFHWHRPDRSGFIVGSRTESASFPPPAFPAMDWGVAHLATPITDYEPMPILPCPQHPGPS